MLTCNRMFSNEGNMTELNLIRKLCQLATDQHVKYEQIFFRIGQKEQDMYMKQKNYCTPTRLDDSLFNQQEFTIISWQCVRSMGIT